MRTSTFAALIVGAALAGPALANLPPPSDAAKAKAAAAAAKAAWSKKVNAHKVCEIENRLAKAYHASFNDAPPPLPTSECVDPGPTPVASRPIEAAGAHSPPGAATAPPSTTATSAELTGAPKK